MLLYKDDVDELNKDKTYSVFCSSSIRNRETGELYHKKHYGEA